MADSGKKRYLEILLRLKSFFFNKNVLSFTVFLFIAAMFWFINTLNKEREIALNIPIEYVNFPSDLVFQQELPTEVKVKARDLGANLWKYVNHKVQPIRIGFNEKVYNSLAFTVSNTQLKTYIAEKLPPSTSIIFLSPDKIQSHCERLYSKTVKVNLKHDISLKDQYMLSDSISFFPEEIEIYGVEAVLDSILEVNTNMLTIKELSDSVCMKLKIESIEGVTFSEDFVDVTLSAEMFTEKSVNLPVQIVNNPQNVKILLFPPEVKVVFNIGVKHFNTFNANDIQVIFDFNEINQNDKNKKTLQVISHTSYIKNIKIQPSEVDYLLEETKKHTIH